MEVKIKKMHPDAVVPKYAKEGDAGLDLVAVDDGCEDEYGNLSYKTGLAFEIPKGFVGMVYPRSSISKYDLALTNSVGVIDSGYRGEIGFKFKQLDRGNGYAALYKKGDKIGQIIIVPYPQVTLVEADTLAESERGTNGFGSSGV